MEPTVLAGGQIYCRSVLHVSRRPLHRASPIAGLSPGRAIRGPDQRVLVTASVTPRHLDGTVLGRTQTRTPLQGASSRGTLKSLSLSLGVGIPRSRKAASVWPQVRGSLATEHLLSLHLGCRPALTLDHWSSARHSSVSSVSSVTSVTSVSALVTPAEALTTSGESAPSLSNVGSMDADQFG